MVLEDGATASQSFEDNVPFSDSDPYASGPGGARGPFSRYPFSAFPTQINIPPRNIFGRLLLSENRYVEAVAMPLALRMNSMSAVLKRYLTQEEADAITSQVATKVYVGDMGRSLGFMVGVSRARLPQEILPPKDIPAGSYSKILFENLRLHPTAAAWSVGRNVLIVGLWTVGAGFLSDFYSSMMQAYATMTDPRLDEYRQTMRSQNPTELRNQITETNQKTVEIWRKESFRRYRQSQGMSAGGQDDASPSGGMMNDYSGSGNYSEGGDTATHGSNSESYSGAQGSTASNGEVSSDSQTRQKALQQHQAPSPPSHASDDTSSGTDFFDDASPTAQDHRDSGSQSSGGSAWGRIRQSASQSTSGPQGSFRRAPDQQQQQYENQYDSTPSSSMGSSSYGSRTNSDFQYSEYERDKQTAKEQAQKEFDRMIDAERSGSDGAGESSGGQASGRGGAWGRR